MTLLIVIAAAALVVGGLAEALRTARRVPRANADFGWLEA